jgi:EAL domain-containing protein (putative c-di-GMP-specific phosphodiesterase class I)
LSLWDRAIHRSSSRSNRTTVSQDDAIVAAIIGLAHSLGLVAVAEGVETDEQVGRLSALQCDFAQGFFYFEPGPPDAIESLLQRNGARGAGAPLPPARLAQRPSVLATAAPPRV